MTDTHLPTEEKHDNRKKGLIVAILLFLLLILGIIAFLFLQTPEKAVAPAPAPTPVHVASEQEKWAKNLAALEAMPIPTFSCNEFTMTEQTITTYDGTPLIMPMVAYSNADNFHFIQSPAVPTHEQLFPDKSKGTFERCAVNIAVPYTTDGTQFEGQDVIAPDLSSVQSIIAPYGYVPADPADNYAVDGVIWASSNTFKLTDTMADVFRSEMELTSTFRDGSTTTDKGDEGIIIQQSKVISSAFTSTAELNAASPAAKAELLTLVSNEQYKVLNGYATKVLHPTTLIATNGGGVGIDMNTGDDK